MDPISARDFLPRLILGLSIAAAAAMGLVALHEFDGVPAGHAANSANSANAHDGAIAARM